MARKKDEIISEKAIQTDVLLKNLYDKMQEDGTVVYFAADTDSPSVIKHWISTGSDLLDLAISNREHGGLPVGKMVEFNGLESTGKSLICAHIAMNTQKQGGYVVYIDTENSVSPEFWESLGVDLKKLLIIQCSTVESVFDKMSSAITLFRKANKNAILTIIVDSVAAASTTEEMSKDYSKDGYNTHKAIIISKAMRKITTELGNQQVLVVFTNQLRQNINATPFGDKYIVPGGKALAYHCSVRVRLTNVGTLTDKNKVAIGNKCRAKVIKNRMGPPFKIADFDIYYDSGIANYAGWIGVLKEQHIITQNGAWYKYTKDDGIVWQFQSKDFVSALDNDINLRNELYQKICNKLIMRYKNPNSKIVDDVVIDTSYDDDDTEEDDADYLHTKSDTT